MRNRLLERGDSYTEEYLMTRRDAVRLLTSAFITRCTAAPSFCGFPSAGESAPPLAPGPPRSPERLNLIERFQKTSEGLQNKFEAQTYKGEWSMPYRLFRPESSRKLPLVVYLHGSGGQGDDNERQLGLGNIFGTRVWLLPENQRVHPCYVLVPQSNRGWVRYDPEKLKKNQYEIVPGPGQGVSLALEVIDRVRR
jgi:hypothetical protein